MLFSLNSKREFSNASKSTPPDIGPGAYEIGSSMGNHKKLLAPFGVRSKRFDLYGNIDPDAPAPGEYNPKSLSSSVAITSAFKSEAERNIFQPSTNPGPSDYDVTGSAVKRAIRPLNRVKKAPVSRTQSGYVGQDITGFTDKDGEWVPMKIQFHGPEYLGPGAYDPQPAASMAYPKSLDSSSERDVFNTRERFPGPGAYSPETKSGRLPVAIARTSRGSDNRSDERALYAPSETWVSEQAPESSAVFKARDQRNCFAVNSITPGPAAYSRPQKLRMSAGNGFGYRAERKGFWDTNANPGPGAYNIKGEKWVKGRNSTTARAVYHDRRDITPGPGQYKVTSSWGGSGHGATSAFASRSSRDVRVGNGVPGPGRYSPRITDGDRAVPPAIRETRFTKLGDWIDQAKNDVPAPDAYQSIETDYGKGRTILNIHKEPPRDNVPGPGTYDVVHESLLKRSKNAMAQQAPPT